MMDASAATMAAATGTMAGTAAISSSELVHTSATEQAAAADLLRTSLALESRTRADAAELAVVQAQLLQAQLQAAPPAAADAEAGPSRFEELPDEVLANICRFLPDGARDLGRLACVSRRFGRAPSAALDPLCRSCCRLPPGARLPPTVVECELFRRVVARRDRDAPAAPLPAADVPAEWRRWYTDGRAFETLGLS